MSFSKWIISCTGGQTIMTTLYHPHQCRLSSVQNIYFELKFAISGKAGRISDKLGIMFLIFSIQTYVATHH